MASRCWHLEQLPGLASMSGLAASPCNLHALWLAFWTLEESGAPPLGVPPVRPTLAFQASYPIWYKQANRDHAIVPYSPTVMATSRPAMMTIALLVVVMAAACTATTLPAVVDHTVADMDAGVVVMRKLMQDTDKNDTNIPANATMEESVVPAGEGIVQPDSSGLFVSDAQDTVHQARITARCFTPSPPPPSPPPSPPPNVGDAIKNATDAVKDTVDKAKDAAGAAGNAAGAAGDVPKTGVADLKDESVTVTLGSSAHVYHSLVACVGTLMLWALAA
ncbi:hypothetical protein NFJ02_03g102570 [Pycnococcus provasolii]